MLLNINKPKRLSSHDVVRFIRQLSGEQRVGHAGTLDPFATGVLVVGVTRSSTKLLGELSENTSKEYLATLKLGEVTKTYDPTSEVTASASAEQIASITLENILQLLPQFTGKIQQQAPTYSALKENGVSAYKAARRGEARIMPVREVCVTELELLRFESPFVELRIACEAGTYIRSIAHDLGTKLGVGAHLTALTRTRVGDYKIEDSISMEEMKKIFMVEPNGVEPSTSCMPCKRSTN